MENNLIVVKQLPIIEDQLRQVKASVDDRVAQALSLACTEETYKNVKKARAELNKEFQDLEARRREVKKAILAPYKGFEKLYKERDENFGNGRDVRNRFEDMVTAQSNRLAAMDAPGKDELMTILPEDIDI